MYQDKDNKKSQENFIGSNSKKRLNPNPVFEDNRAEAIAQMKLKEAADKQSKTHAAFQLQESQGLAKTPKHRNSEVERSKNNTGLPDQLKSGIENLSGYSMDDVKVHYNSNKPAQLQAHAYAKGTEIHIASGQEKHLAHETWHVVQQKQGRVKPTLQMKGKVNVNDEKELEKEADEMGAKATLYKANVADTARFKQVVQKHQKITQLVFAGGLSGINNMKDLNELLEAANYPKLPIRDWFGNALLNDVKTSRDEFIDIDQVASKLGLQRTSNDEIEASESSSASEESSNSQASLSTVEETQQPTSATSVSEDSSTIGRDTVISVEVGDSSSLEIPLNNFAPNAMEGSSANPGSESKNSEQQASSSSSSPQPIITESVARSIANRIQIAEESKEQEPDRRRPPPMINTGRVKIYAPENDELIVYRAEKAERNTLDERRSQGGLEIWRPSSSSIEEAFQKMFALITNGQTLGEFQFTSALNTYAQRLRAEGQPDNLATARTVEGAYTDNFNYTIKIPGVRLFKWASDGVGELIPPGAEIKKHYIVLNADTIENSTIFGIGHVTGTQEVSFYSNIPGNMIESVREDSFSAEEQSFTVLQTPQ